MIKYDSSHPDYRQSWDEWSLRVDADGTPVPEGQESDSDFFAKSCPGFKYGGTIHGLPDEMAHRYPDLKLTSFTKEECEQNLIDTRKMMFVLAQTPGRALIEIFTDAGMTLKIHPDLTKGEEADAICDYTSKNLWLNPRLLKSPQGFGALGHEFRHIEKNRPIEVHLENDVPVPREPGFLYDYSDTLNAAVAMVDIQEPDARMMSILVRASFLFDQPGDHPRRWKPAGYESFFDSENPTPYDLALKDAVMKAGHHLETGQPEKFMREIFLFERARANASIYYHAKVMQTFLEYAIPPVEGCKNYRTQKSLFDDRMENFMQVDYCTPERIAKRFPYLADAEALQLHKAQLHPDAKVARGLEKLKAQIETLGTTLKHEPNLEIALRTLPAPAEIKPAERLLYTVGITLPDRPDKDFEIPAAWLPRPPAAGIYASPQ